MIDNRPVHIRLMSFAGQENCDGEPYDTMQEGYEKIVELNKAIETLQSIARELAEKHQEIVDRFDDKLSLHKEDCFAYQTSKEALAKYHKEFKDE